MLGTILINKYKIKVFLAHNTRHTEGLEVQLYSFFNTALDGDVWSV